MLATALAAAIWGASAYARAYARRVEALCPAEGRFFEAHGARLHVREAGPENAPRALLIHGASSNLRELWGPLANDLARDHRVVAYDRPGHGHSTRPKRDAHLLATQARMAAAVLEATGEGPALIVAHSLGCAVALRLALEHPELVAGLVLAAPATHPYPHENAWWARLASTPVVGDVFCTLVIPWIGPVMGRAGVANNFWPQQIPAGYYEEGGVGLFFRASTFAANARDVCATKAEFAAQAPRYANLLTPAIIISAEKDRIVSPKRHARALASELATAELVTAPDAGHMPHRMRPDLVLSAVRRLGAMVPLTAEG